MDGVLVRSEPLLAQAAIRMFAEKGYTVAHEEFRPFIGMGEDRFLGGVAEARRHPARPGARQGTDVRALPRPDQGPASPPCRASAISSRPAVRRGLALAVASSADEIKVNGNLDEIGLPSSTFDVVVNGSEVAKKKPAPDIFLEACRRLGLEPAACLVIEDARRGGRRRQGRRLPLPGRHHLVPRRKARRHRPTGSLGTGSRPAHGPGLVIRLG